MQIKNLFEKFIRKYGFVSPRTSILVSLTRVCRFEEVDQYFPEEVKKLLQHLNLQCKRQEKKKAEWEAAKKAGPAKSDDKHAGFEKAFAGKEGDDTPVSKKRRPTAAAASKATVSSSMARSFSMSGDEPLDLLDPRSLAPGSAGFFFLPSLVGVFSQYCLFALI